MRGILISCLVFLSGIAAADDWSQWLGSDRSGVWRDSGILEKFPKGGPEILWRLKIGSGYSGPAVSGGRVYVTDRELAKDAQAAGNPFQRGEIPGTESVLCIDSKSGHVIWKHKYSANYTVSYAAGPRATPLVEKDRVFTLGAEGHLFCLKTEDGSVLWEKNLRDYLGQETPTWGYAAAPLIYGELLITMGGGQGSTVLALDKNTGKEVWRALAASEPGYCPPTLIKHGGKDQVIVWHPDAINSLNPVTGKLYWSIPWKLRSGLSVPTPKQDGDHLFFTAFYNGSTMLRLKPNQSTPDVMWQTQQVSEKRTTHLNSIMPTPVLKDGVIYGVCSYGELRCLDQQTGERIWETMAASTKQGRKLRWFNIFLTPYEDRYFLFNEEGNLISARLSPDGYEELDRAKVIEPNGPDMRQRNIVWSHPAYADGSAYIRNDSELIRVSLRK